MREIVPIVIAAAFSLALAGCMPEEAKSPEVHMCKSYNDEASCLADSLCKWKAESPDKPAKCKAK